MKAPAYKLFGPFEDSYVRSKPSCKGTQPGVKPRGAQSRTLADCNASWLCHTGENALLHRHAPSHQGVVKSQTTWSSRRTSWRGSIAGSPVTCHLKSGRGSPATVTAMTCVEVDCFQSALNDMGQGVA